MEVQQIITSNIYHDIIKNSSAQWCGSKEQGVFSKSAESISNMMSYDYTIFNGMRVHHNYYTIMNYYR